VLIVLLIFSYSLKVCASTVLVSLNILVVRFELIAVILYNLYDVLTVKTCFLNAA